MSVESFVPNKQLISMTPSAIKHFETKLADQPGALLRLSTKMSGCTGYAYVLNAVTEAQADDELVEVNESLTVAVAKDAVDVLRNTEIDYVKEGINGVVKFNNPNVVNECGCGESFSVQA
tara:strand:- start:177 stop:536 length:360 start_codon:yes stop_codon:yes gene_type:complete